MASETNDNRILVAVIFVAWTLALLIAFLSNHGPDFRQLRRLPAIFSEGTMVGWGGLDSFVGIIIAALIGLTWFGLGSMAFSVAKLEPPDSRFATLAIVYKIALGAASWSLLWFFLGLAGLYNQITAVSALSVGLILAGVAMARLRRTEREGEAGERPDMLSRALPIFIFVPVLLAFIASLAPPIAKDTLLYHFAVPKAFISNGSNAVIEGNIASYLALGTEMHVVWTMLLGNIVNERAAEVAAGATTYLFFPLLLLAVHGWARAAGISKNFSLIASLMVASVPTAYHVASSGYIDLALALYVTLAAHSLCAWWKSGGTRSLVMIAVFLGAALSIKLTSLFVIAAFTLVILLKARTSKDNAGRQIAGGLAALAVAGIIALPWYARTWAAAGSPVFPFYMSIWKGEAPGWDVERSNLFQAINSQYGGAEKTASDYITVPWRLSVGAQPEDPNLFDGVLGAAYLLGLPVLAFALWKFDLAIEAKIGAGIAGIMFLFWLSSSQQLRYLLPILPALAVSIAASAQVVANHRRSLERVLLAGFFILAIPAILVAAGWFARKAPVRAVLGGETRASYLARNLDYYPYYQLINSDTAPDARTWLINMRRDTYHIDGPVISDYMFEDWTLRQMVWESRDASELKARAAALGIKYIMTRHDFLFDYTRSTLVDDKRPRSENESKLAIAKELLLDKARAVRQDEKFSLVKLF